MRKAQGSHGDKKQGKSVKIPESKLFKKAQAQTYKMKENL